jgi:lysophospholipase L1-like esterase
VIQLGPSFAQARQAGEQPYRDDIHPNEVGQRIIARTLMDWITAMIREEDSRRAGPSSAPTASPN